MRSQTYVFNFSYAGMTADVHVFPSGASVFHHGAWHNVDDLVGHFALALFKARLARG